MQPTDAEVKARFEANKDAYKIPERRVLSYILLDREALRQKVVATDREIEVYYQDHQDEFRQEEQACASHILVKVKQPETGEGHPEAEAQQLAQGLLDQVKAGGDFAALAKKSSEDQGSAQNGGDLGCFAPGRMVPEFDEAVAALQPGPDLGPGQELVRLPHHPPRLAHGGDGPAAARRQGAHPRHGPRPQDGGARRGKGAGHRRGARQGPVARAGGDGRRA